MKTSLRLLALFGAAAVLSGCGDSDHPTPGSAGADAGGSSGMSAGGKGG